jgi:RNA polymerase sigma factor (sigma-70 family)
VTSKGKFATEPDRVLIDAVLAGDAIQFEGLVLRYSSGVYRFILKNVGSTAIAEDLTQETFVEAYRNLATFKADAKFSTWLFGIALNRLRKHLNRSPDRHHDYLFTDDAIETTKRHEIEVEVVLPQENINYIDLEQLQMAIDNLMEVCEFELKGEVNPIRGSWWKTLIFWSKDKTTQTVVNRLLQTLKEVFVARSIGIPSAEETKKLAEAIDQVLKNLEKFDSGIIRLGKLLIIKGTLGSKPVLRVETISPSLAQKLAENPQLIKMPEPLLHLIEEQKLENQVASDLVSSDKSQGDLSPEEPLVQLPPSCSGLQ